MNIIDFILHIDKYLHLIVQNYGILSYFILFFIVFCETGLVFTPFLPGDSLLFVAGTLAANGVLNLFFLFLVFVIAAILGDTVNYWIGNYFGERVFLKSRFVNKNYIEKTKEFYKKQAEAYEKDNRRSHALKIYEKLLLMGPSDQEREEIKAKLTKLYEQTGRLKDYFRLKGGK